MGRLNVLYNVQYSQSTVYIDQVYQHSKHLKFIYFQLQLDINGITQSSEYAAFENDGYLNIYNDYGVPLCVKGEEKYLILYKYIYVVQNSKSQISISMWNLLILI